MLKRFHTTVYMPSWLRSEAWSVRQKFESDFQVSLHAKQRVEQKLLCGLPHTLPEDARLIEVRTEGGKLRSALFRFSHPEQSDLDVCLVLSVEGVIVTVWTNRKRDRHSTLDTRPYQPRPKETR